MTLFCDLKAITPINKRIAWIDRSHRLARTKHHKICFVSRLANKTPISANNTEDRAERANSSGPAQARRCAPRVDAWLEAVRLVPASVPGHCWHMGRRTRVRLIVLLVVAVPVGLFLPQNWPLFVREFVILVAVFAGLILWERVHG